MTQPVIPVRHTVWLAGLLTAAVACSGNADPQTPDLAACPSTAHVDTDDWTLVDDRAFDFRIPPSLTEIDVQPIDSHVRVWEGPSGDVRLSFDYGRYSNALTSEGDQLPGFPCSATIDGRQVRIVAVPTGSGIRVAASWRDVPDGTHLTMSANASDEDEIDRFIAVFRSVDFTLRE